MIEVGEGHGMPGAQISIEIVRGGETVAVSAKTGMTLSEVMAETVGKVGHAPDLPCGGKGICLQCAVRATGELSQPSDAERSRFTRTELVDGRRLACQARVMGPARVVLDMPEEFGQIFTGDGAAVSVSAPVYKNWGVAVDVGTTTLCARLCGPGGAVRSVARKNPQAMFGADVISRIGAALGGNGAKLAGSVRGAVSEMLAELSGTQGIGVSEIDGLVLTGNTTMLYLLTGHDPEPLSHAPFEADRVFGEFIPADSVCRGMAAGSRAYLPRCISAFVGADITAAVLASGMCRRDETALLVDAGTNGELALWHDGKLLCCSTAAGPAFEGGGITNGVYGVRGAIDRVWLEAGAFRYSTIGGTSPIGICGSGIVDATAALLETGMVDETGAFAVDGRIDLGGIEVNARDVRAIQLAKGAVRAGIETLLQSAGVDNCQVSGLYISGGFGNYLNLQNAAAIGLIPPELLPRTRSIGNAALAGAEMLLKNGDLITEADSIASGARTVALDANPVFMDHYMRYMIFE